VEQIAKRVKGERITDRSSGAPEQTPPVVLRGSLIVCPDYTLRPCIVK